MHIPASLDVALKEWDVVCQALASGEQMMLLRKGGIQEAAGEFQLEHRQFLLFPTFLHQERRLLKEAYRPRVSAVSEEPQQLRLALAAEVADIVRVERFETLRQLDEEHVWTEELLRMRWDYRPENPLYLLLLRVARLEQPVVIASTPAYAGCRSWVKLDAAVDTAPAAPVLDDAAFATRRERFLAACSR